MTHLELLPPPPPRFDMGALMSLAIHAMIVGAVATGSVLAEDRPGPLDQLAVFLVPLDRDLGRRTLGAAIDWSAIAGTGGATEEPMPKVDQPEQTLPIGTVGDTVTVPSEPSAPEVVEETALSEIEVDSAVVRDPNSMAPAYPAALLAKGIGEVPSCIMSWIPPAESRCRPSRSSGPPIRSLPPRSPRPWH